MKTVKLGNSFESLWRGEKKVVVGEGDFSAIVYCFQMEETDLNMFR